MTTRTTWTTAASPTLSVTVEAGSSAERGTGWRLLSIKDVAAACRLSEKAVRRAIVEGELPAVKLRSRLRVTPEDFAAWIEASRGATVQTEAAAPLRRRKPHPAGTFRALLQSDSNLQARR